MKLKIDPARFKPAAIAPFLFSDRSRKLLRSPWTQGVGTALLLAAVLYGWLAYEAGDTIRALDARTPAARVAVAPLPDGKPGPAVAAGPKIDGALPGLIEMTPAGALPRIGPDGTPPWRAYARPADAGARPKIAILMTGLGLSASSDARAVQTLPAAISLAFLTYADRIAALLAEARAAGHEVVLNAPMEPDGYPADDPGPRALLVKAPAAENVARLQWDLARGVGYVGIAPAMGSRFTASPEPLQPVLAELAQRGLLYVDTGTAVFSAAPALARTIGVPIVLADRRVDRLATPAPIDRELTELENTARSKGAALGIATPYPVTFDRLLAWIGTLDAKGIALVPVSALADAPSAAPRGSPPAHPGG